MDSHIRRPKAVGFVNPTGAFTRTEHKPYLCDRPAPTPTISYTIIHKQAAGCIIITASHNPGKYNGFNFRPDYAGSAWPDIIKAIEAQIKLILC